MPSSLSCGAVAALTALSIVIQIAGISIFAFGFFPVKPALPGVSGLESYRRPTCNDTSVPEGRDLPPERLKSMYEELSEIPRKYDRLILMVIDGLPAEFVLGRGNEPPTKEMMDAMPYTQYLLSKGNAIGFHARAAPPTVTMPRLKAIVSGTVGGFLDVAFNFHTQAFLDDNLLEQMFFVGWKMVMHGDETWIKLFPRFFIRQDGVSSFYVKDTVEVDYNVSRHLESELAAPDWDLMILHYLGLDHVGHIGGRQSALMIPKLKEMDEVIKRICSSAILNGKSDTKRTLLMVTSDHGMTDGGNHGGSSYEETDSLALFIDLGGQIFGRPSINDKLAYQVDIVPTLSLLFGIPIPKNNVGVLMMEVLNVLTDGQKLRALELNSWQLLRLLQSQLPSLLCEDTFGNESKDQSFVFSKLNGGTTEKLCLLYLEAVDLHKSWKNLSVSNIMSDSTTYHTLSVKAYLQFLQDTSKWLSNQATEKPTNLLAGGMLFIITSSLSMLKIFLIVLEKVSLVEKKSMKKNKICSFPLHFDEACIIFGILLHLVSLGSSSMVEEEQYIWHFLSSTLYIIFLFMTVQTFLEQPKQIDETKVEEERKLSHSWCRLVRSKISHSHLRISSLLVVLICGRILRGWHQGGVNWLHLPDISKWLERSGRSLVKILQIASLSLVAIFGPFPIYFLESVRQSVKAVLICHFVSVLLILVHMTKHLMGVNLNDNSIPQIFYMNISVTAFLALASPWFVRIPCNDDHQTDKSDSGNPLLVLLLRDCICLIGGIFTSIWCLLQLLLQHPIDAMPILLLLFQILASKVYFALDNESIHQNWVKVAAMYFLGMAGHFGLGNSNSIATVDVAGAFTGLSSHSTVLVGILMFAITYASPLLFQISEIMSLQITNVKVLPTSNGFFLAMGLPCLVPLVLNSASLTAFTIVLLLMRNHLFIWSVFSPKYLYVCMGAASIYIGVSTIAATVTYVFMVLFYRAKGKNSMGGSS